MGGVGFGLEKSAVSQGDLPPLGEETLIFTSLVVREDALQLYGFSSEDERELFGLLLSVSKPSRRNSRIARRRVFFNPPPR